MTFTGQITSSQYREYKDNYEVVHKGVRIIVVEPEQEGVYNNKCTLWIENGTEQQYPVGSTVTIEPRLDVKKSQTGNSFTNVKCHVVTPEAF